MNLAYAFGVALSLALVAVGGADDTAQSLAVGDRAPDFTLQGTDGKTYTLDDFRGKRPVVIAWFPKAFTAG